MYEEDRYSMRALVLLYMANKQGEVENSQMKRELKQITDCCGKNGLYISLDFIELGNDDLYSKPFNYIMGKLTDLEYVKMYYGDGKIAYEINENVAKELSDRNSVFLREFSENELNILQDAVHSVK